MSHLLRCCFCTLLFALVLSVSAPARAQDPDDPGLPGPPERTIDIHDPLPIEAPVFAPNGEFIEALGVHAGPDLIPNRTHFLDRLLVSIHQLR